MDNDITKIINDWNPIDIHPLVNSEYQYEMRRIVEYIKGSKSIESNAAVIYAVFKDSFGSQFTKTLDECKEVARKIF